MSLKGFANRLSYDCRVDIDADVSTAYCGSSSVTQVFNNRRKLGRTKNLDIDNIDMSLVYFITSSTGVATR